MTQSLDFGSHIRGINTSLQQGEKELAFGKLLLLLREWKMYRDVEIQITKLSSHKIQNNFDVLANALIEIFTDVKMVLDREQYLNLLRFRELLANIFYLSYHKTAAQILEQVKVTETPNGLLFPSESDTYKFLLFVHLFGDELTDQVEQLIVQGAPAILFVALSSVTTRVNGNEVLDRNQQRIRKALTKLQGHQMSRLAVRELHLLWVMSSYLPKDENEHAKLFASRMLREWIRERGVEINPKTESIHFHQLTTSKPRLLILAEALGHNHVIYRCLGASLKELRSKFYVTVMTTSDELGEHDWDWCDELISFDRKHFSLAVQSEKIQRIGAEVIVYPSIGMTLWCLLLSRLRLAPLQVNLMGHPDWSHSDHIDYHMVGSSLVSTDRNTQRLITMKSQGSLFDFTYDHKFIRTENSNERESIRIVCTASMFKASSAYLRAIKELKEQVNRPIEIHLMQNMVGLHYQVGRRQVEEVIGSNDVYVYPRLSRENYFELLCQCDLYLSPFPFGGENSLLDALLSGLPAVAMIGHSPMERLDYRVLHSLGLDEQLGVKSIEEYLSKVVDLVNKPSGLKDLQQQVRDLPIREILERETREHSGELATILHDLYQKNTPT